MKSFLGPGPYLGVQVPYPELSHWEGRAWPATLGPSGILEGRKPHLMVLSGHSWQCLRDARDWTWVRCRPGQCPLPCVDPLGGPYVPKSCPLKHNLNHTQSVQRKAQKQGVLGRRWRNRTPALLRVPRGTMLEKCLVVGAESKSRCDH